LQTKPERWELVSVLLILYICFLKPRDRSLNRKGNLAQSYGVGWRRTVCCPGLKKKGWEIQNNLG